MKGVAADKDGWGEWLSQLVWGFNRQDNRVMDIAYYKYQMAKNKKWKELPQKQE